MIKFHNKNNKKSRKLAIPRDAARQSIIKKTDAKLTDILVNGVKLPGYEKLSLQKKKKQFPRYLSTSFQEAHEKQLLPETMGLFKNTAIRTRLKSLQIQIAVTHRKPQIKSIDRKYSYQKEVAVPIEDFLKTSTFSNQSQRYISPHTSLNWTHKSYKSKKPNIEHSVRCHSNKNKSDNPLWPSHNQHFNDVHLQKEHKNNQKSLHNFNDCLLTNKEQSWSLRISKATEGPTTFLGQADKQQHYDKNNALLKQSQSSQRSKGKVCYSIKLRKQQKLHSNAIQPSPFESLKEFAPKVEQQPSADTK